MNSRQALAWHYTIGARFQQIVVSGVLLPANAGVVPPEKPVVWFSMHQLWEPTACKAARGVDGIIRRLSFEETCEYGGGGFRFSIEPHRLLCGRELRRKARMSAETWDALALEGQRQGANPSEWLGHMGKLDIRQTTVQSFRSGQWADV